ncbi:hypothetical protein [Streptomyces sp. NPDC013489]|uniref:hypothetical protein n=1 Tax=Streptomyces sp. NPDC013489 TaxID=3155606 RepID=UPI0033C7A0A5
MSGVDEEARGGDAVTRVSEASEPSRDELCSFVRYQLGKMGARNEHHRFEDLCRALSRERITRNILTATGPVSSGGDQGRDFETFISYAGNNLQDLGIFLGVEEGETIVFCCTLQATGIPAKIRSDVQKIFNTPDGAPSVIFYFTVADVSVATRHSLEGEVRETWGAKLEVIDGNSLAELLVDPECVWIATEYLHLSHELMGSGNSASAIRELAIAGDIIVRSIGDLDPVRDLGIHPPLRMEGWRGLPAYVARAVDPRLDDLVRRGGLVVIEGNSASGKTRTAFEAILRIEGAPGRSIVIPRDGVALRKLISSGYRLDNAIVWLDDLERFIGLGGLDEGIVRLFGSGRGALFIATIRSRAKSAISQAGSSNGRSLASVYRAVMAGAKTVRVDRHLNKKERGRALDLATDLRIRDALESSGSIGFAEFIAAAPSTLERWKDGKDGASEVGAALISAAVDFRRAGYSSAIQVAWLESTFSLYLDERTRHRVTRDDIEDGLIWATELIHGASSCLEVLGDGLYAPFDYLVDYAQERSEKRSDHRSILQSLKDIPDDLWHELSGRISVDDPSFMSCVSMASLSPHPGLEYAYRQELLSGSIPVDSLSDSGTLLNFARSCLDAHICIVCQAMRLKIDLTSVLSVLLEEFSGISEEGDPTAEQIDCMAALSSIGSDSGLGVSDSPLHEAAGKFSSSQWRKLGEFMVAVELNFAGRCWIAFADTKDGKKASWPVSLEKAQGFYFGSDGVAREGG